MHVLHQKGSQMVRIVVDGKTIKAENFEEAARLALDSGQNSSQVSQKNMKSDLAIEEQKACSLSDSATV